MPLKFTKTFHMKRTKGRGRGESMDNFFPTPLFMEAKKSLKFYLAAYSVRSVKQLYKKKTTSTRFVIILFCKNFFLPYSSLACFFILRVKSSRIFIHVCTHNSHKICFDLPQISALHLESYFFCAFFNSCKHT